MNKPFVSKHNDMIQLYSGNDLDMVPFLSVRKYNGNIIFQIPGSSHLEVDVKIACKFIWEMFNLIWNTKDED